MLNGSDKLKQLSENKNICFWCRITTKIIGIDIIDLVTKRGLN